MRALVTGGNGFVGRYLVAELRARGDDVVVAGHARDGAADVAFDLRDAASVAAMVAGARPQIVYHLAAQASVADATRAPLDTYESNVLGTARLIEAVRERAPEARVLFTSSAEVYGAHDAAEMPLRETTLPRPATAYAASKLAAEAIVLASARSLGVRALVARPFNLIGPRQTERFVVAAFAGRLARIAAGAGPLFPVGNLTPERDFLDVRDAVRAYVALADRGADGEIYNVCGGVPTKIADVLRQLVLGARVAVEIREDPALVRPVDVPLAYGDNAKLRALAAWSPEIPLARTLRDIYAAACEAAGVASLPGAKGRDDGS